jgi:hypothetical protein
VRRVLSDGKSGSVSRARPGRAGGVEAEVAEQGRGNVQGTPGADEFGGEQACRESTQLQPDVHRDNRPPSDSLLWPAPASVPVGAENRVTSCNRHILVDETAESISAQRPDCRSARWASGGC